MNEITGKVETAENIEATENTEKEILYKINMQIPESFYIIPFMGKKGKIRHIIIEILELIFCVELIILVFMNKSHFSPVLLAIPLLKVLSIIFKLVVIPKSRKKQYQNIHSENEDLHCITFYTDSLNVKSPSSDINFNYNSIEGYFEDDKEMIIDFSLNRAIFIDKRQCTAEQIDFIKSLVPPDKQKKHLRKPFIRFIISFVIQAVCVLGLCHTIGMLVYIEKTAYVLNYPKTTYDSFVDCVLDDSVEDVLILNDKYIEYTFTGYDEDERFYTVCTGDIMNLKAVLDDEHVKWKDENAKYLKLK